MDITTMTVYRELIVSLPVGPSHWFLHSRYDQLISVGVSGGKWRNSLEMDFTLTFIAQNDEIATVKRKLPAGLKQMLTLTSALCTDSTLTLS